MQSIIDSAAYRDGKRVATVPIDDISEVLRDPEKFVWIGLHEPGHQLLRELQTEFCLHDLAVEDALKAHQRPKMEVYGDSIFITLRTAEIDEKKHIGCGETHFFVGTNYIVSIRHGSTIPYKGVRSLCERTPELLAKGPAFALYAVMDSIVDQYFPVIEFLEHQLISVEDKIFNEKPSRETTQKVYELKRELLEVKRAISPVTDICGHLMRFDIKLIPQDTKPYFRDVYDHALRINEMLDNTRELVTAALEANFSLTSINQSEVSKKFAGWAAIVGVPTMIAGIYGMNFKFMPGLEWKYSYPLVLGITVFLCVLLYLYFKKADWL